MVKSCKEELFSESYDEAVWVIGGKVHAKVEQRLDHVLWLRVWQIVSLRVRNQLREHVING